MPHSQNIARKEKPATVLKGQKPKTTFKDAFDSIEVDLIYHPSEQIDLVAYGFQKATWADRPYVPGKDEKVDAKLLASLKIEAMEGNGLPLSLELYDFVFAVSGISRIITHQIVRTRVGATYSQQCSGDKDWRHHDAVMPRSAAQQPALYEAFKQNVLNAKQLYADMLDTMEVPILDARKILPHCLETFIYVKFNLATLVTFIKKRDCVQTQEPEMVLIARQMRTAILAKFPQLEGLLQNECKRHNCFYTRSDRLVGTSMFLPDKDHDFEYNKDNFIYPKTVHEMVYDLPPVPAEHYIGTKKASAK
ncbi:MAG TPA: FAD-dependent thymidylate synthase [Candidatus Saccharimonadales bacterium]|nr:FAD-dependent thymidylate synthase [Candidatus Saccharimonadales bacterium]